MKQTHTFHIPVMGTAFTADTPLKVAQYGIDSVVSIVDDVLIFSKMGPKRSQMWNFDPLNQNFLSKIDFEQISNKTKSKMTYFQNVRKSILSKFRTTKNQK